MTGPRLVDRWLGFQGDKPCVVRGPLNSPHEAGGPWWASPDLRDGEQDVGFKTHAEAIAWLDRRVRRAE